VSHSKSKDDMQVPEEETMNRMHEALKVFEVSSSIVLPLAEFI
jgi:hypothetical protein